MRVLIVEDELTLQQQIYQRLQDEQYVVDISADGKEGLYLAREYPLDAAIIDIGLPGISGLELIHALRQESNPLPVLILTARSRWQDKVEGLEAGADDYLAKPFQMEELLARLKALLRRTTNLGNNHELQCGPVVIDINRQTVTLDNMPVQLTTFEYRLLEYLAQHAGKVVSKDELTDYLYPHDEDRDSNVIEVMIARLRRKLDVNGTLKPVETLRGRGYRLTLCDGS
ncbi:MAG: response regulator transcription factor [Gammaproteobacteria bacterium]|nr:MAG: response regulator transcription factor [Gammaproteobacteria bacterium]